ncbi:hypothetical protein BOTBODRAFT_178942 [Botryobasidium botryosum FD-172 SS1]|uniref:Large ribosomal subunit protein bL28c n=1 Tax=Botryobasidium botryosum (strain FD-172 SS1) TaxID=930990 RepID=A0A067M1W1_BOTB1|nr:hypothetical protein BOTBODRAFT_178942 [Botryobasidium botryosum FD-172 SS1]
MFPSLPVLAANASRALTRQPTGLFGGKTIRYGNNVPHSMHKTRRTWLPNIQTKRLYSETLGEHVRLEVTARTLRTIDKYGGLDAYLLGVKDTLLSHEGMRMRVMIKEARRKLGEVPQVTSVGGALRDNAVLTV